MAKQKELTKRKTQAILKKIEQELGVVSDNKPQNEKIINSIERVFLSALDENTEDIYSPDTKQKSRVDRTDPSTFIVSKDSKNKASKHRKSQSQKKITSYVMTKGQSSKADDYAKRQRKGSR
jgi:hypothetical protein